MAQTLAEVLANATLYTDDQPYIFLTLPPNAIMIAAGVVAEVGIPFCAMIVDKDEVSLMLPEDTYLVFSKRLVGHERGGTTYRLITLDIALASDLVGLMAQISKALAEAHIPIFPYAAYTRDHIFVPTEHFNDALAALKNLPSSQ